MTAHFIKYRSLAAASLVCIALGTLSQPARADIFSTNARTSEQIEEVLNRLRSVEKELADLKAADPVAAGAQGGADPSGQTPSVDPALLAEDKTLPYTILGRFNLKYLVRDSDGKRHILSEEEFEEFDKEERLKAKRAAASASVDEEAKALKLPEPPPAPPAKGKAAAPKAKTPQADKAGKPAKTAASKKKK